MTCIEGATTSAFVHHFRDRHLSPKRFFNPNLTSSIETCDQNTELNYANERSRALALLLNGVIYQTEQQEMNVITANESRLSLAAESIAYLALRDLLPDYGLIIDPAPQNLEKGDSTRTDKGHDLIISHMEVQGRIPLLGINIKLQRLNHSVWAERMFYSPRIRAPSIQCSLGNWQQITHEGSPTFIREWLKKYVIPSLHCSDSIPHFNSFRRYIIHNIHYSLECYGQRATHILEGYDIQKDDERQLIPDNPQEIAFLLQNLERLSGVFKDLAQ